ncbi:MAG: hypothetical protein JXR31_00375, partial [Prolixibacteraceae bacterium]|nr:hypothetical protein [Prolixibacteraceae bacterium]MBN2772669.1 hypothetical protein [Prolixibacteraceae bacterium]
NNIRVGYTIPAKLTQQIGINSVNIFVSGDNLFLLSSRKGYNPATDEAGTSSIYRYDPISTYTLGVKVKF